MSSIPHSKPKIDGLHHLKFAVSNLDESMSWWESAFGAVRQHQLDHVTKDGRLVAYVFMVPGIGIPIQLRVDPELAASTAGLDAIALAVPTTEELEAWAAHFDRVNVNHSRVFRSFVGWFMTVRTPDGLSIRLHTRQTHEWDPSNVDFDPAWMRP